MMRRRTAVVVALVLAATVAWFLVRRGTPRVDGSTAAAPAHAAPKGSARDRARPTELSVPRFASATGPAEDAEAELERAKARAVKTHRFRNGVTATVFPTRIRYATGRLVQFRVRITDPDGTPVSHRGDLGIVVTGRNDRGELQAWTPRITADPDHSGEYYSDFVPPAFARRGDDDSVLTSSVLVTDDGRGEEANERVTIPLRVELGAPAWFAGRPRGAFDAHGLSVRVVVAASIATPVVVRALVADAAGVELGEASASADLAAGGGSTIVLRFPGLDASAAEDGIFRLVGATVFAGASLEWSDFIPEPRDIELTPE